MIRYNIDKINRIDSRYYLIRVNKNYYVIDYSNPRDFRNWFFVPLFPERLRKFDAYDVTGDEKLYMVKNVWRYQSIISKGIFIMYILILLDGFLMPSKLNIFDWTFNLSILYNPFYYLKMIIIGIFCMIFILNITALNSINLNKYKKYELTDIYVNDNINFNCQRIKGLLSMFIIYPSLFIAAILGRNYALLIQFGFVSIYAMCFIKFIEFRPSMKKQKFYIKEE